MAETKPTKDDVEEQIKQIRDDISNLTGLLKELAEDRAGDLRDTAVAEAQALVGQGRQAADRARVQAHEAADSIEQYIVQKPLQSALIALGAGLLIGLVSRR